MAGPIPWHLLPDSAVDSEQGLTVGGLVLTELAGEFGTPLFVYDEAQLRARCREAVAAFGSDVAYATKAFLCTAMAKLAHDEGMKLDVATGGEIYVALRAGVPADRLVFHGNNKSEAELTMALAEGIGRIVIDSYSEMDRIDKLVSQGASPPKVLLRITPGVKAETHEFVQTGQDDSKFGFGVAAGEAQRAIDRASNSDAVELVGLHAHIGSQVFRVDSFAKALEVVAGFSVPLGLPELNIGGGLGVAYVEGEEAPSISQWAAALRAVAQRCGIEARLSAEPGRSIAAAAAVTLYEIGTIKDIPGIRTYISVNGGMSDNPRPVLYGSGYESFLPRAVMAQRPFQARVVGKHCESGDVLLAEAHLPADAAVGDILATPVTGAYGLSMGSNYNKVLRPAAVFVKDGAARLVVRRETYEDLVRLDVP
ncbi:MAG: diaminopimelate decarboxylase [Acidimicrobiales bacterium]